MKKNIYNKGFSLVEIVVGAAVCLIVIVGLSGAFSLILKLSLANTTKVQASFLEEEGIEAVRILRDNSWAGNIATQTSGVPFFLSFTSGTWATSTRNVFVDNLFERKVTLTSVYRDGSQNIVSSGGTLDPKTMQATVSVSWLSGGATTTKSLSTYITNIFNN